MKKLLLAFIILASITFVACTTDTAGTGGSESTLPEVETETMDLTLDELAQYNGKDGAKAYIAINGVIYDVTDDAQWTSGEHGGQMAGTDVTAAFPHSDGREANLPVVGNLVE